MINMPVRLLIKSYQKAGKTDEWNDNSMQLVLAGNFAAVREKYIEVIENTKDMNIHARWIYGKHPSDAIIQSYIDRQEMYLFMDGQKIDALASNTPAQRMYEKHVGRIESMWL
ncbi:MAG: hypothetical protein ACI4LP_09145 [Anaerovoracaceae bacterium]